MEYNCADVKPVAVVDPKLVPWTVALVRFALVSVAEVKFALVRFWPEKLQLERTLFDRLIPVRLAPV